MFSNPSIKINKSRPPIIHNVLKVKSKFKCQLVLLPKILRPLKFTIGSSVISINNTVTDNIIRGIINIRQEEKVGPRMGT